MTVRAFEYTRATDIAEAVTAVSSDPHASFLAGGTTQLDLMKDGVLRPHRLIDIGALPLGGVTRLADSIRVGALTTMEELAAHPVVVERLPLVRESLLLGASPQLRNMATIGGNLLQRTRCGYFRDPTVPACNKRLRGSGCTAVTGAARPHAVLGVSDHCIALHASDLTPALVALDATVDVEGPDGPRSIPLAEFYLEPGETPDLETVLAHGELITAVEVPLLPVGTRSGYLKVRDRASFDFALVSCAAAVLVEDGVIRTVRLGLGGVGTTPRRARAAEDLLRGGAATPRALRAAARTALLGAVTVPGTAFKVPLAERTVLRALQAVTGVES